MLIFIDATSLLTSTYHFIYEGKECRQCIEKCPISAIKDKFLEIDIGCKKFQLPEIDLLRCDWAKKYALIQDEGPKYLGCNVLDIKPPKNITENSLCEALKKFDQIPDTKKISLYS